MTPAEAKSRTLQLLYAHGVTDWVVTFNGDTNRAGFAEFQNKQIGISMPFLAARPEKDCIDMIRHEVAHVLVGWDHDHDEVWAAKHIELGGNGQAQFGMDTVDPEWHVGFWGCNLV